MPAIAGVELAGRRDPANRHARGLLLVRLAPGSAAAGMFTRSKTAAAPVVAGRESLHRSGGRARALIVNAGNANAFTGAAGLASVADLCAAGAGLVGAREEEILCCSTGVIGVPLPATAVTGDLPALAAALSPSAWQAAADAIRTTDTFAKAATTQARIDGAEVQLAGIAKGSGMIAPDLATMLAFIFTDAAIAPEALRALLGRAVARSFNCITVDGDTSTSDTILAFATGKGASHRPVTDPRDPRARGFAAALGALCRDLAIQIVRDGEGARKLIEIAVSGASSSGAARRIGLAIANSPLVKTAIAGEDANWGRIVMAVGKSGERADPDLLRIEIGGQLVAAQGAVHPDYDESLAARHLRGDHIAIKVDIGVGRGKARVWTCDLTAGYIAINADYRS